MDALSSQATVSATAPLSPALLTSTDLPLLTTAAEPFVRQGARHGVGVAGLQAIATAKRLGARFAPTTCVLRRRKRLNPRVRSSSSSGSPPTRRAATRAKLNRRRACPTAAALLGEVASADIVITTAAVPGRKSPILLTTAMVEAMGRDRS